MGKKSKSKSKIAAAASVPSAEDAIVPAGGGKKKARCTSCFCIIKRGESCISCDAAFCWRCEAKYFVACPNGEACLAPMRRCSACVKGQSLRRIFEQQIGEELEPGDINNIELLRKFKAFVSSNDRLLKSRPFIACDPLLERCQTQECAFCFESNQRQISHCIKCGKHKCRKCTASLASDMAILENYQQKVERGEEGDNDAMLEAMTNFAENIMSQCKSCGDVYCPSCITVKEMCSSEDGGFECSKCYFSRKPCTNPNCPQELGVPTKRCGACHIDRYCSVDCQAAMYPAHVGRCQKIQEKRAERESEVEATKELLQTLASGLQGSIDSLVASHQDSDQVASLRALAEGFDHISQALSERCGIIPKEAREEAQYILNVGKEIEEGNGELSEEEVARVMGLLSSEEEVARLMGLLSNF